MVKEITTIYLEKEQKEALGKLAAERGERFSTALREAIAWYMAITPYTRDALGELSSIYIELSADAIIARLIADDARKRIGQDTKTTGIRNIKADTEKIIGMLEAARAAGCDCVEEFDEKGMEL